MTQHAINRARKRHSIDLSFEDLGYMITIINANQSIPINSVPNTKTFHLVKYAGKFYKVLYDKIQKKIITIYPKKHSEIKRYNKRKNIKYCKEFLESNGFEVRRNK